MSFNSIWGGKRNGTSTFHFSAVNAQCSVNILRESLHYRLIELLIKLSLIASLIAAIIGLTIVVQLTNNITKKEHQGVLVQFHECLHPPFQVFQTPTNTYDGLFEDGTKVAAIISDYSARNAIKRRRCKDLLQLLPCSSLYWSRDIEVISDLNDFAEAQHMDLLQLFSFSSLYWNGDIEMISDTNDYAETLSWYNRLLSPCFVILLARES